MMVAMLSALIFTAAFAVAIWSIWITIRPRLGYMRALLRNEPIPALAPATAPRARVIRPAAISTMARPAMRAAA